MKRQITLFFTLFIVMSMVFLTIPEKAVSTNVVMGDINGDGVINLKDLVLLTRAYGSKLGDRNWNSNADFDQDGIIGNDDFSILTTNYGQGLPMTFTVSLRHPYNPDHAPDLATVTVEHAVQCVFSEREEMSPANSPNGKLIITTPWYNWTMIKNGNVYTFTIVSVPGSIGTEGYYYHFIITAYNAFGNATQITDGAWSWHDGTDP